MTFVETCVEIFHSHRFYLINIQFNLNPQRRPFIEFELKMLKTDGDMDQNVCFLTSEWCRKL